MAGYGDDAGFDAWMEENGYKLPADASSPSVLRHRGSVYIDGLYGMRFVGERTGGWAQERAWPRTGAYANGALIPGQVVPLPVVYASYEAALQEAREPGSLSLIGSAADRVKREKVDGAVEVEYQQASSENLALAMTPVMTVIEGLLSPFLQQAFPGILVV